MSETPQIIEDFLRGKNDAGGTIASLEAEAKRLSDEIEETGIDPLKWAREEIKRLQRHAKSLELRDAANGKCKKCGTLHAEPIIHCDVCGAFQ